MSGTSPYLSSEDSKTFLSGQPSDYPGLSIYLSIYLFLTTHKIASLVDGVCLLILLVQGCVWHRSKNYLQAQGGRDWKRLGWYARSAQWRSVLCRLVGHPFCSYILTLACMQVRSNLPTGARKWRTQQSLCSLIGLAKELKARSRSKFVYHLCSHPSALQAC